MIIVARKTLAAREHLHVSVTAEPSADVDAAARSALDRALDMIEQEGFFHHHIVRSRLFTRDEIGRKTASSVRLSVLSGDRRGASSSYIDPDRLPPGSPLQVDLVALRAPAGATKQIREYDPVIAPPMSVTLEGMLYLSGMTDTGPGLEGQSTRIGGRIDAALALAGASRRDLVGIDCCLARSESLDHAWRLLTDAFPALEGPMTLSLVKGFSRDLKRLEIESTARL